MKYPPICFEGFDGSVKWRVGIPNLEHGTLCKAFQLDPCSTWFELPSSAYGYGSALTGAGVSVGGQIHGYVFQGPKGSEPIGKLYFEFQGRKIRDADPFDRREFNKW